MPQTYFEDRICMNCEDFRDFRDPKTGAGRCIIKDCIVGKTEACCIVWY